MELLGVIAAIIAIVEFIYLLYSKTKKRMDVRIYENSSCSDDDMVSDLANAKSVSFFGFGMTIVVPNI